MNKCLLSILILLALPALALAQPESPLRDPTQPIAYRAADPKAPVSSQLQLSAIFLSERGASAIVNGQRVKPGDSVAGVRIERIEAGRVYFHGERSGVLRLHAPILTLNEGNP